MTEEVRQALRICPLGLRQAIDRLPDAGAMEELRLRCGQPPACRIAGKERALPLFLWRQVHLTPPARQVSP